MTMEMGLFWALKEDQNQTPKSAYPVIAVGPLLGNCLKPMACQANPAANKGCQQELLLATPGVAKASPGSPWCHKDFSSQPLVSRGRRRTDRTGKSRKVRARNSTLAPLNQASLNYIGS